MIPLYRSSSNTNYQKNVNKTSEKLIRSRFMMRNIAMNLMPVTAVSTTRINTNPDPRIYIFRQEIL